MKIIKVASIAASLALSGIVLPGHAGTDPVQVRSQQQIQTRSQQQNQDPTQGAQSGQKKMEQKKARSGDSSGRYGQGYESRSGTGNPGSGGGQHKGGGQRGGGKH